MPAKKESATITTVSGAAARMTFNGIQQIMGTNVAMIMFPSPLMLGFLQVKEGLYATKAHGMPLLQAGHILQLHTKFHALRLEAFILMALTGF